MSFQPHGAQSLQRLACLNRDGLCADSGSSLLRLLISEKAHASQRIIEDETLVCAAVGLSKLLPTSMAGH
jgi:hypothetical protein